MFMLTHHVQANASVVSRSSAVSNSHGSHRLNLLFHRQLRLSFPAVLAKRMMMCASGAISSLLILIDTAVHTHMMNDEQQTFEHSIEA
jgi:hypothetical protein